MSQAPTRREIFALASKKLRQDFQELRVVPHSGAKGDEADALVRQFFNDHLPKRFFAGRGFIIDRNDEVSRQTDVIIYDALNCPVYRASDDAAIIPSNNVAAVIEVKSNLDKEKLLEAVVNISAAKHLRKAPASEGLTLEAEKTLGCIFAFESSISLDKVSEHLRHALIDSKEPLGRHVDAVLVLDRGVVVTAARLPGASTWSQCIITGEFPPNAEGTHLGLATRDLGDDSLDWFLRYVLGYLAVFRAIVDHPGFGVPQAPLANVRYLTTVCNERDPVRRSERLKAYRAQIETVFAASNRPPRS